MRKFSDAENRGTTGMTVERIPTKIPHSTPKRPYPKKQSTKVTKNSSKSTTMNNSLQGTGKKIKFLHDNGYNQSNIVPPQQVLRSRLHPCFPILFLPEYIKRRRNAEVANSKGTENGYRLPHDVYHCYQRFLMESSHQTVKTNKKKRKRFGNLSTVEGSNRLHEILVRAIVVPLSSPLISKVSRRIDQSSSSKENEDPNLTDQDGSIATETYVAKDPTRNISAINVYKKARPKSKLVTQSLEDLIDGVISTLVHQKKRSRCNSKAKADKGMFLVLEKNVLCEGYNLASDDYVRGAYGCKKPSKKRRRMGANVAAVVPYNSNMKPGVQCNRPNSCASFARSAPLMKLIITMLGDDLMREMMLKCMVFIPVEDDIHDMDAENYPQLKKGNYFQLCGPSLATVGKKFTPEGFNGNDKSADSVSISSPPRKRHRNNNIFISDENENIPNGGIQKSSAYTKRPKAGKGALMRTDHCRSDPHWTVPRHYMFFSDSFTPKVGLPPSHLLNNKFESLPLHNTNVANLLDSMVQLRKSGNSKNMRQKRWKRLREVGIEVMEEIIKNHRKCDYDRFLNRACPLSKLLPYTKETRCDLERLVACYSPTDGVVTFLKGILKKVFPQKFWGSLHNFQVVLTTMKTFISMKRKEQMTMEQLMRGIRVLDMKWLFHAPVHKSVRKRKRSDHEAATSLMQNIMRWLYCNFIIPLIKSSFYATSTQFSKDKIVYYRKPVWSRIRDIAWQTQLQSQYKRLSANDAIERLQNQTLGHSRLQLLPKEGGIRPIALLCKANKLPSSIDGNEKNMTLRCRSKSMKWRNLSTNQILRRSLDVLTYEYRRQPSHFGAGVLGMNHVHNRFLSFVNDRDHWKESELFFASVDIQHCFDNINQAHLLDLIKRVMRREEYVLQEHTVIRSTSSQNDVKALLCKNKCIVEPGNVTNFLDDASSCSSKYNQSIIVDNVKFSVAKKETVCDLIQEHLLSNMLMMREKHGRAFLLQKGGIPQGSVLSTILCNYYYGDIETELLGGVFDGSNGIYLLVRIVDDFLLVTSDKSVSQRFLSQLSVGNSRLGVKINPRKTRTSYDRSDPLSRGSIVNINHEHFFPWCGLLFNTRTCEVRVDYGRFGGTNAFDNVATNGIKAGATLSSKMKFFVKPRCQPFLYDSRLNSNHTVAINFYQMIILSAIKTTYFICHGLRGGVIQNSSFVKSCIMNNILFAHGTIGTRLRALAKQEDANIESVFKHWLKKRDALWLGTHAFQAVFVYFSNSDFAPLIDYLLRYCKERKCNASLSKVAHEALRDIELSRFHL